MVLDVNCGGNARVIGVVEWFSLWPVGIWMGVSGLGRNQLKCKRVPHVLRHSENLPSRLLGFAHTVSPSVKNS